MVTLAQIKHKDFLTAILGLYKTLDDLAILEPKTYLILPPPDTGFHPPSTFNASAACLAGYSDEAVELLAAMPYLDVKNWSSLEFEIEHSTWPLSYVADGGGLDVEDFGRLRLMLDAGDMNGDWEEHMPESAIRLSWEEGGHGVVWIYDVESKLMVEWDTFENWDGDTEYYPNHYFDFPAQPPQIVLGPLTDRYRRLDYIGTPMDVQSVEMQSEPLHHILLDDCGKADSPVSWQMCQDLRRVHLASHETWLAVRGIKAMYIECGWDVDGLEQTSFRREEFIAKRAVHWTNVVEPLMRKEEVLHDEINWRRYLEAAASRGDFSDQCLQVIDRRRPWEVFNDPRQCRRGDEDEMHWNHLVEDVPAWADFANRCPSRGRPKDVFGGPLCMQWYRDKGGQRIEWDGNDEWVLEQQRRGR